MSRNMLRSWIKSLGEKFRGRSKRRTRQLGTAGGGGRVEGTMRPLLETLESRVVPTSYTYTWTGAAGTVGGDYIWENSANWSSSPTGGTYPHLAGDTANFAGASGYANAPSSPVMLQSADTIKTLDNGLTNTLTLVSAGTGAAGTLIIGDSVNPGSIVAGALDGGSYYGNPVSIQVPLVLGNNLTITTYSPGSDNMTLSYPITQSGGSYGISWGPVGNTIGNNLFLLSDINTLTGPLVINGGANNGLGVIATPSGLGSEPITVNTGGQFTAYNPTADPATFTNAINFAGNGNLIGGLTKWEGTINIASGATATISSNELSPSNPFVIAGSITGAGNLTLTPSSSAMIMLAGANVYTGSTTISSGYVAVATGSGFGASGTNGYSGVTDSGTLYIESSTPITINNPISGAGTVQQLGGGAVTFAGSNTVGSLTFPGNTTGLAGLTILAGGTSAFGQETLLAVATGNTLGGVGSTAATVTLASSTISPSLSGSGTPTAGGTLNVAALSSTSAGSVYDAYLNGSSTSTSTYLTATGNINLTNLSLNVLLGSTLTAEQTYTILSAGSITGTFTDLPDGSIFTAGNYVLKIHYVGSPTVTSVTLQVLDSTLFSNFIYVDAGFSGNTTQTNPFFGFNSGTVSLTYGTAPGAGVNAFKSLTTAIAAAAADNSPTVTPHVIVVFGNSGSTTESGSSIGINTQVNIAFVLGPTSGGAYTVSTVNLPVPLSDASASVNDTISIASGVTVTMVGTTSTSVFAPISGAGSLTYAPTTAATLTLSGANTYSGTTTVSSGILNSSSSLPAFSPNSLLNVASGATVNLMHTQVVAGLMGAGIVENGSTLSYIFVVNVPTGLTDSFTGFLGSNSTGYTQLVEEGAGVESLSGGFVYYYLTGSTTGRFNTYVTGGGLNLNFGTTAIGVVTGALDSGSTATITAQNDLVAGESVTISGVTPTAYNNTYSVLSATSTSFTITLTGAGTYTSGGTLSYIQEATNMYSIAVLGGSTLTLTGGTSGAGFTFPGSNQLFVSNIGNVVIQTGNTTAAGATNAPVVTFETPTINNPYFFNGNLTFETTPTITNAQYTIVGLTSAQIGTAIVTVDSGAQFASAANGTTTNALSGAFDGNLDASFTLNGNGPTDSLGHSRGAFQAGIGSTGITVDGPTITIGSNTTITDFGGSESSPLTINSNLADAASTTDSVTYGSGESAGTSTTTTETIDINGTNTTAGTTVAAGTLLNVGGLSSLGTGTVTDNGTGSYAGIVLDNYLPIPVGGSISGTGNFTLAGSGGITFSNSTALSVSTPLTGVGPIALSGSNSVSFSGSITTSGGISLASSGSINFNNTAPITVSSVITGIGPVTISGTSSVDLTGTGNSYNGATTVNSGATLLVDGTDTASSITVASGATLGGHGTISGATTTVNGTLNPATVGTTGTINISTLTFGSGGTFAVDLLSASNDEAIVSGTATLTGSTLTLTAAAGYTSTTPIIILQASSLGSTTFSNAGSTVTSSGGQVFQISYVTVGANKDVVLTLVPTITANTNAIPDTTSLITINGTGFSTTKANDAVTFTTLGVTGTVNSVTSSNQLIVAVTTYATSLAGGGNLTAIVTVTYPGYSGTSSAAAQVATLDPTITASTTGIPDTSSSITIYGTGFSTNTAYDTVSFTTLGVTGTVSSAPSSTELIVGVTSATPTAPINGGILNAQVTVTYPGYSGTSSTAAQVATLDPTITASTTGIPDTSSSITIYGTGFSTNTAYDSVSFTTLGVTGTVSSAPSSTELIVGVTSATPTAPINGGILNAQVTVTYPGYTGTTSTAAQVATLDPTVTATNTNSIVDSSTTITIFGTGFSTTKANDTVTFTTLGVTGTVSSAPSSTELIVGVTTPPTSLSNGGSLIAQVTVTYPGYTGTTSAAAQVATVTWDSVVTRLTPDSGTEVGTLRYALANVQAGVPITFEPGLTGTLSLASSALTVSSNVTITGPGATSLTINGGSGFEAFAISSGETVTIGSLTIANGNVSGSGGGIYNQGTLTLSNVAVSGNVAGNSGGGIYNSGSLLLNNSSIVEGNTASGDGGGGIYNSVTGILTLTGATVSGNSAPISNGGGIANYGMLTLNSLSSVSSNYASNGGGIYNAGTLSGTSATISNNTAKNTGAGINNQGGALSLSYSTISHNHALGQGGGGFGIAGSGPTVTLTNDTISNNTAGFGAGIYDNYTPLTISNSTFSGNISSHAGAGIYANTVTSLTLTSDSFSLNAATLGGGGLYEVATTMSLNSSTFTGNSAKSGGGINVFNGTVSLNSDTYTSNGATLQGGAIYNSAHSVTLSNVTVSDNGAVSGGGIYNTGTLLLNNGTSVNENFTTQSAGGGIYNSATGNLTLTAASANDNSAPSGAGGGIYNHGVLTLNSGSSVSGNLGGSGGGILNLGTVMGSGATINSNSGLSNGGGIYNSGILTLSNSSISSNSVITNNYYGGGIFNQGPATLTNDIISSNVATYGAGIATSNSSMTLSGSTLANNVAHIAGAIYANTASTLTFTNDTLTGNSATTGSAGAIDYYNVSTGSLTLYNSTITGNYANIADGGIGIASGTVYLVNTIVAGNTAASDPDVAGTFTIANYDLIGNTTGSNITSSSGTGNVLAPATLGLDPLNYYGGTTESFALLPTSPAVGAGTASNGVTVDQRGISVAIQPDIGAFQLETVTTSSAPTLYTNTILTISGSAFDTSTANDSVSFSNGVTGSVTGASSTSLTVTLAGLGSLTLPTALTATVTVDGAVSTSGVQVATVQGYPTVTSNPTNLAINAPTITITGSGFSPNMASDSVTLNLGAVGNVTAANATSLTVSLTTDPTITGTLTAVVTVTGIGTSGSPVQVATVGPTVSVTTNSTAILNNVSSFTINGSDFSPNTSSDSVTFNDGAVGTVTAATSTSLTISFTTYPTAAGNLNANVSVVGVGSSGSTQVASIYPSPPTLTGATTDIPTNTSTLTINGYFGSSTAAADSVSFNLGAQGTVMIANSNDVVVSITTPPTHAGPLDATVTIYGVGTSNTTQVATVIPTVTANTAGLLQYDTSMTIAGTGFDIHTANDSVTFTTTSGTVTGSVLAATSTSLTVSLTGLGSAVGTALDAVVTVDGVSSGGALQVATVQSTFGVDSATLTPSGVVILFNGPIDPSTTVLYTSPGDTTYTSGADVTLLGSTGNSIRGSLVIDLTNPSEATFVETSGLLPTDTYTLAMTSAVKALGNNPLVGGYTSAPLPATVATTTTPVVSIPSFARGPGQPVELSNTVGIPINFTSPSSVTQASFTLTYDPSLLSIASAGALTPSADAMTAGLTTLSYTIVNVDAHHSILTVNMSGGALSGPDELLTITASIPNTAVYRDKSVLSLGNVTVNNAPASGVSGVQVVDYVGDAQGTGIPNANDASLVNQVGAGAGTGFSTFKDLDPFIIAGISASAGDYSVNATDASLINEAAAGASSETTGIASIPSLPDGMSLSFGGPDPYLYLGAVQGAAGQTVTETLYLDVTDPNGIQLTSLDEAIGFNAGALQISNIRLAAGLAGLGSYGTASNVDNTTGVLLVGQAYMGSGLPPLVPYGTDIAVLQFDVTLNSDMPLGAVTGLTVLQDGSVNGQLKYTEIGDNEGALTWTPGKAPSNSGNPAIDGSVTVVPATIAVTPPKHVVSAPPKTTVSVRRPTTTSQPVTATSETNVSLDIPVVSIPSASSTEVTVVTNVSPLLPSPVVFVQAEISAVIAPMTVAPTVAPEGLSIVSPAVNTTKVADPGASLSLAALGTNKGMPIASTSTSNGKLTVLDEMYHQLGTSLNAPLGNSYYLGLTGDDATEELGDIWDLEAIMADLDARRNSDEQ